MLAHWKRLVLLNLIFISNILFAASALPVTPEENERELLPNFILGWSKVGQEYRFTLSLDSPIRTWIAIGTSQGIGIGSPLMTTNAAAVIAKPELLASDFVAAEYELKDKTEDGIVPWETTGPSQMEITRCVQSICPDTTVRCQSHQSCVDALQCASDKFAGNLTSEIWDCTSVLGEGSTADSIDALGAFLDTAGCYFTNCATDLSKAGVRLSNIHSVSASQVKEPDTQRYISILSFTTEKIGYVDLNSGAVTLMAAYGTGSQQLSHGPDTRTALTLNLETGVASAADTPSWILGHVAMMTIGLGILIPVGIAMKVFGFAGHARVQLIAVGFGFIGVFWAGFFVEDIGSKPHHVLGIVVMIMFVIQPATFFFRPSKSSAASFRRNQSAASKKKKKGNDNLLPPDDSNVPSDEHVKALQRWGKIHGAFGTLAMLFGVVNSFLGAQLVQESQVDSTTLTAIPVVFACLACLAIVLSISKRVYLKYVKKPVANESQTDNSAILATSSNPNFDNKNIKTDDLLDPPGPSEEGELRVTPCYLVFKNVSYRAPMTRKEKRQGNTGGKQILSNCSGFCAPGTLTAIMGPSGSGKTSLLDILASRARNPPEAGSIIEVNGVPIHMSSQNMAKASGYVLQEDILHQYLTVFETLMTTARLILPANFTDQQRYDRVMRVVAQLGLGHAIDTKVGGPEVRGLSGGERRRVSVGIQMVKSPSLLFLDEPTSGLDSSTACKLVECLRDLANEGRTVVATIHQPSVQIFNFFDRLVLLSAGMVVWSGLRTGAEGFFQSRGRPVPPKWNPADWFLLVVDTVRESPDDLPEIRIKDQENDDGVPSKLGSSPPAINNEDQQKTTQRMSYRLPMSPKSSSKRPAVKESVLRMSVAAESREMDVSILTEVCRNYYAQHNPEKMKQRPEIIDEVVKYGMRKGVSELDKKLIQTYGEGILQMLTKATSTTTTAIHQQKNQPLNRQELEETVKAFQETPVFNEIDRRLKRAREEANQSGKAVTVSTLGPDVNKNSTMIGEDDSRPTVSVSLGQQIRILTERGATLTLRDPQVLKFQALQNIVFGIVLGSLYSNLRHTQSQAYTLSMAIAIILGIVAMITIALGTAVAFSDKQVFVREQNDYMYSPVAHFFARLIVGLPTNFIIAACLILPSYFWIGLKATAPSFFFFFFVNLAMIFLFDGVVGVTAFLANDVTTAFGMGNFYEAISIFMSGIFIPYPLIPPFWVWLYYLTPFSYAYAAAAINEFENTENEFWLFAIGIIWLNKWGNLLVIIVMGVLWRVWGLILAIRINKRATKNMKPKSV